VSDTEGVFSRRLVSNWAELPTTLRRRQKHRPDILNQFTDYSESSENELHRYEQKAPGNVQRIVHHSEFLRKLDCGDIARKDVSDTRKNRRERRAVPMQGSEGPPSRLDEGYWRHYENQELRLPAYRKRNHLIGRQEKRNLSDEDRKTNSPDSLLMKSSESELSSDEYGHTDDSGAFLEQASQLDKASKAAKRSSFIKFFTRESGKQKRKTESDHLDINKNIRQGLESFRKESLGQQKFEYENIPRIDVSKLDQKSLLYPIARPSDNRQPTIEQLRLEEGCELRNALAPKRRPVQQRDEPSKPSDAIRECYESEQMMTRTNGERKTAKMETITEENADGSKLSVREILKRFEENLRTQSDVATTYSDSNNELDDKTSDKTMDTIQETLRKLDEKAKGYQIVSLIAGSMNTSASRNFRLDTDLAKWNASRLRLFAFAACICIIRTSLRHSYASIMAAQPPRKSPDRCARYLSQRGCMDAQ